LQSKIKTALQYSKQKLLQRLAHVRNSHANPFLAKRLKKESSVVIKSIGAAGSSIF